MFGMNELDSVISVESSCNGGALLVVYLKGTTIGEFSLPMMTGYKILIVAFGSRAVGKLRNV